MGRLWCFVERAVKVAEWVGYEVAVPSTVAASAFVLVLEPEPLLAVGACLAIDDQRCFVWVSGCWSYLLYRRWRLDQHNRGWGTASRW